MASAKNYSEQCVSFDLCGHALHGILSVPEKASKTAVIIVVGGPQYRVGSHRQFVLLARHLADNGILVLRFDYSGMGYSEGTPKKFYEIDDDIKASIDFVLNEHDEIENLYLWGLCDAASAISFMAYTDSRIKGVVLLNPWVRSEASYSKAIISGYYKDRIFEIEVWKNLLKSPMRIFRAIISLSSNLLTILASLTHSKNAGELSQISIAEREDNLVVAMFRGMTNFKGKICLVISMDDLVADEFDQEMKEHHWLEQSENNSKTSLHRIEAADHTFSSAAWSAEVENITLNFVSQ